MPSASPVLRVRRLALAACVAAGGVPRVAQLLRSGIVVRASELPAAAAPPPPPPPPPPGGDCDREDRINSLLAAYCRRTGQRRPSRAEMRRRRDSHV